MYKLQEKVVEFSGGKLKTIGEEFQLHNLLHMNEKQLIDLGFLKERAELFYTAVNLVKELANKNCRPDLNLNNGEMVTRFFRSKVPILPKHECFWIIGVDVKNKLETFFELTDHEISEVHVSLRYILNKLFITNSKRVVVIHNHPSGVADPSMSDKVLTENLTQALELFGITLIDHFVITEEEIVSTMW